MGAGRRILDVMGTGGAFRPPAEMFYQILLTVPLIVALGLMVWLFGVDKEEVVLEDSNSKQKFATFHVIRFALPLYVIGSCLGIIYRNILVNASQSILITSVVVVASLHIVTLLPTLIRRKVSSLTLYCLAAEMLVFFLFVLGCEAYKVWGAG